MIISKILYYNINMLKVCLKNINLNQAQLSLIYCALFKLNLVD
nr:MAG TPA: hypothetical protein [Caudoviricetes sp.]